MLWWEEVIIGAALFCGLLMVAHALAAYLILRRPAEKNWLCQGVSVIKPIFGLDTGAEANLRSFLEQDYPGPWEIIFSLQDPRDPALPLIHRLIREYPQRNIRLLINPVRPGFTGKTSNLYYGTEAARYPLLVWSDADMRAAPDFLRRLVAPLEDPQVGMVAAVPVHRGGHGLWDTLYRLQLNATILAQWVPYVTLLPIGVSGGTLALRREVVEAIGGVMAFANYLLDDVRVGLLVRQAGYRIAIGPLLEAPVGGKSRDDLISLVNRGAVIYHLMLGGLLEYVYLLVAYLYWPMLILAIVFLKPAVLLTAAIHLLAKSATAWLLHRSIVKSPGWAEAAAVPVLDAIFLYLLALQGHQHRISWRGITYSVDREGRLVPEQKG